MDSDQKFQFLVILLYAVVFVLILIGIDSYWNVVKEETKRACLHQAEITPACKELLGIKK